MSIILGIESSCDDTGVAIVDRAKNILANVVISQNREHEQFQGVVPEIAARAHINNIEGAISSALAQANLKLEDVDAIAATSGPGLIGGVIVGCMIGKTLASVLNKPFIAINHLEGHALTARLTSNDAEYPFLLLLVSGGHCQFIAVKGLGNYQILGQTIDDAVGEAFDKVAKMMSLPFPGGPEIERLALSGDMLRFALPKPLINSNNCNMSFSGLKTAVKLQLEELKPLTKQDACDIAASFQYVVGEVLAAKTIKAIETYEIICQGNRLVIAGGVAANQYLKQVIKQKIIAKSYNLITPPIDLCTDNAAMIAYAGLERFRAGLVSQLNFCPKARWSLEEL